MNRIGTAIVVSLALVSIPLIYIVGMQKGIIRTTQKQYTLINR